MFDFNKIIVNTRNELFNNSEWIDRYSKYAEEIDKNITIIKNAKKYFHQWKPLYLYMSVSKSKNVSLSKVSFDLRYAGQKVADLFVVDTKPLLIIDKNTALHNQRDFKCSIGEVRTDWLSREAQKFRQHFRQYPLRENTIDNKGNDEHRCESMLLTEFSKSSSKEKHNKLSWIQPVLIGDFARFQMPTPLKSSSLDKGIKYAKQYGGGIDILSRVRSGNRVKLCIMEVKDENISKEPPQKAVAQGLSYALFIRELLRSTCGKQWWKIFGFSGNIPNKLQLLVCCVMPSNKNNDISFSNKKFSIENDEFELHYIYFKDNHINITDIESSLAKRRI